jgi:hypothetical protein
MGRTGSQDDGEEDPTVEKTCCCGVLFILAVSLVELFL